jgi:hypothetical protein
VARPPSWWQSRKTNVHQFCRPPINADEHRQPQVDSLSEKVLGAVFEVAKTLCRISGKGFGAGPATRTRSPRHAAYRRSYIGGDLQGAFGRRILCRSPGRRRAGSGVEMCRTPGKPTYRPMSYLSGCLWPDRVSSSQFSEAQSRVAAMRGHQFWFSPEVFRPPLFPAGLKSSESTGTPRPLWTLCVSPYAAEWLRIRLICASR